MNWIVPLSPSFPCLAADFAPFIPTVFVFFSELSARPRGAAEHVLIGKRPLKPKKNDLAQKKDIFSTKQTPFSPRTEMCRLGTAERWRSSASKNTQFDFRTLAYYNSNSKNKLFEIYGYFLGLFRQFFFDGCVPPPATRRERVFRRV